MGIVGILLYCVLKKLPGCIDSAEVEQRDTLIHLRDLEFGIERGRLFKGFQGFFEKLLVHVGGAEIVETCGFSGLVWLACPGRVLRLGCEDGDRRQYDGGTNEGDCLSHAKNKLTTKGTKVHKGKSQNKETCANCHTLTRLDDSLFRCGKDPRLAVGFVRNYAFAFLNRDGLASGHI